MTVSIVEPVTPSSVALIEDVPVATPVARPARVGDGGDRGRGRRPGHLAGEVLGRVVGVGAGGRELLGFTVGDARVGRRHGDRLQAAALTVSTVEPVTPLERGADGGSARSPRPWPAPLR